VATWFETLGVAALLTMRNSDRKGTHRGHPQASRGRGLARRPAFHITHDFLNDVTERGLMAHDAKLHRALLIMHFPSDDTVGIEQRKRE
jgi:hypothetical protein